MTTIVDKPGMEVAHDSGIDSDLPAERECVNLPRSRSGRGFWELSTGVKNSVDIVRIRFARAGLSTANPPETNEERTKHDRAEERNMWKTRAVMPRLSTGHETPGARPIDPYAIVMCVHFFEITRRPEDEADLPAESAETQAGARISQQDADPGRTSRAQKAEG